MKLKEKVALITGGANGIGREAAILFAKEGASVVVADYNIVDGEEIVNQLNAEGFEVMFQDIDVADRTSIKKAVEQVINRYGKVDILVNNAGITRDSMLLNLSEEEWQKVIDVNLSGVFYCTQDVVPYMLKEGKGKIINTSSVSGIYGNIGQTNYAATKAGVVGITKTLAKELGAKGINVNAVAPGFIETGMVEKVPEKVINKIIEKVPLKRLGKPIDIAYVYLFLASGDSDYVNGAVIPVDGGIVL